jgi:hypothetical protein
MEPNTLVVSYLTALEHGVSNPEFQLEKSISPLHKLTEAFLRYFDKLENQWDPLLLSYDWFEEAAKVKRRVLARGGNDHTFFNDICKAVDNEPLIYDKVDMKDRFRQMFLLGNETFTFSVPGGCSISEPWETITPWTLGRGLLELYQSEPPDSWKHELYDMKEKVLHVLDTDNKVIIGKNMFEPSAVQSF